MAKRGKSKILASMLAVSTMAVFYAAPVMAADLSVTLDGQGIVANETVGFITEHHAVTGTLTIGESALTTALSGTDLTLNSVTANTISTTGNNFTVGTDGDVKANSVTTTGDVSTASYSLNTVGANTAGITKSGSVTTVEGVAFAQGRMDADYVLTDGLKVNGLSELDGVKVQNGSVYADNASYIGGVQFNEGSVRGNRFSITDNTFTLYNGSDSWKTFEVNSDQGTVMAANGNFNIDAYGNVKLAENATVDGVDVSELQSNFNTTNANVGGIEREVLADGSGITTIEGATSFDQGGMSISTENGTTAIVGGNAMFNDGDGITQISGGDVMATGDVISSYNGEQYSLNTIGANTAGIERETYADGSGSTTIEGSTSFDANGMNVGNGAVVANTDGSFSAANGSFGVDTNGNVTANKVTVGDTIVTGSSVTTSVLQVKDEAQIAGTFIENGVVNADNVFSANYNLEQVGANLGNLQNDFNTTNANVGGIIRDAAEGAAYGEGRTSIEGVISVDGNTGLVNFKNMEGKTSVLINAGTGQVIANSIGAEQVAAENLSAGNGALRVTEDGTIRVQSNDLLMQNGSGESVVMTDGGLNLMTVGDNGAGMVTLDNGVVSLMGGGTSTVTINGNGTTFGTVLGNETTNINGGTVTASEDVVADGVSLKNLAGEFGETNANVAGIKRTGSEEEGWTTTIEDTLSVSDDQVLAQTGSSQLVLTGDVAGLSSGNASFALTNNELQLSVAGNGMTVNQFGTTLNGAVNFTGHDGNSYTLSDLEGRVYDLEQKTQNITSSEPGQGGEGSTVPPTTDGHTGVEGDVTVGGDLNVNGSVNVGDTIIKDDGINIGEGTHIGDGVVSSTNGNFDNIDANEATIGETNISKDGTVTTNKVVTGNTTLDNEGLNVGGKTSVTADGVNVGGAEGTSIKHDEISVGDGGYIGGGDVVSGEGVSLNQTAERVGSLENRVGELEDRIDKVGAMAAAIANLRSMGYDPAAPTEVAVGIGQYRDETGAALGLFHYPNRDFMLSLSVSTSGDEVMGGIGATWKFGRKSPEKVAEIKKAQAEADVRRAEAQKLEKAEAMKQAAKEAKIKAQQERHAKLAAERAAQAEAAK